jgi:ferredoxin
VDDCPYDAVRMVPRTDGLPHPLQAWVDPERCVGCGVCIGSCDSFAMNLVRLDTRAFEQALVAQVGESARAGEPAWVALVAADAVSAPSHGLDRAPWGKLLPGFRIEPVPTASWVRTRLVENLLRAGAGGVLLVRDARAESAARDGNRWVEERLLGRREPPFNPARAGRSTWAVVDHDPARPGLLRAAAEAFRAQGEPPPVPSARPPLARGLATVLLHAAFLAAAILPSHLRVANPASPAPALVFTFRAFGERGEEAAPDPAEQAKLPVHMRGRSFAKPHRRDVQVRIEVDGQAEERAYRAKGVSRDGPVNAVWRMPLSPGPHAVRVELRASPTAEPSVWAGEILARPRVTEVLSYEPGSGFRREP